MPAAFGVFAIDKIRELPTPLGVASLALLLLATLAGAVGYETGYLFAPPRTKRECIQSVPRTVQDGLIMRRFLEAYSVMGEVAIDAQLDQTINISVRNGRIREFKRVLIGISLALFVLTAIVVGASRVCYTTPRDSLSVVVSAARLSRPASQW